GGIGGITVNSPITDFGSGGNLFLSFLAGGSVVFNNTANITGNLTIVAGVHGPGTISGGPSLFVGGQSSFTNQSSGGTISLSGMNALFRPISLNTTGAGGDVSLTNTGGPGQATLAASSVSGNLVVVNMTGNLTQSGALTVAGTSSFTNVAPNGTIVLENSANALTGAVSLNTTGAGGDASLTNDAAGGTVLGTSSVGGNLSVLQFGGNLTQSGALTVGGTSSFAAANGTIVLTNAANALSGAVSLVTVGSPLVGNASLTNDAAGGTVLGP